jgi:hypothetical protein
VSGIARARKGETIDELAARLFRVADPKTGMKAAAERLVAANRHLALKGRGRARALVDDAFVVVPEVEGTVHDRRAAVPLGKAAARALLKRTNEAVEELGPALEHAHRGAITELKETLELADSDPLQSAAKEDEALARRLDQVRDWTMNRIDEVDRAHEQRMIAVERAARTITELLERAGTGS